jgi:hypothetical protein
MFFSDIISDIYPEFSKVIHRNGKDLSRIFVFFNQMKTNELIKKNEIQSSIEKYLNLLITVLIFWIALMELFADSFKINSPRTLLSWSILVMIFIIYYIWFDKIKNFFVKYELSFFNCLLKIYLILFGVDIYFMAIPPEMVSSGLLGSIYLVVLWSLKILIGYILDVVLFLILGKVQLRLIMNK